MKRLRVLALIHKDRLPPDSLTGLDAQRIEEVKRYHDVVRTLRRRGHTVEKLGLSADLGPLRHAIQEWKPDITFNLMEGFHDLSIYDHNVVSYLELMRVPYTGCNPRGLILARDKALAKKILVYHGVLMPDFVVFPQGGRRVRCPARLEYPLIVKALDEDASAGISQASIVRNEQKLAERVKFVHSTFACDAIAERFIDGRELYVGVLGNRQLRTWPPWELVLEKLPAGAARIATERVKFNPAYQKRHRVRRRAAAGLSKALRTHIDRVSRRIYRSLNLSGYARMDFRLTESGELYFLEANPNPDIEQRGEFAAAAAAAGVSYGVLLDRILRLAAGAAAAVV